MSARWFFALAAALALVQACQMIELNCQDGATCHVEGSPQDRGDNAIEPVTNTDAL